MKLIFLVRELVSVRREKGGGRTVGMPDFSSVIREGRRRGDKKEFDHGKRRGEHLSACASVTFFVEARNLSRSV